MAIDTKKLDQEEAIYRKKQEESAAKLKKQYNASFDASINATKQNYDTQMKQTESQYDDLFRVNEVQAEINKRQINETMANMGLTNSGLSRSQQTASVLQKGNVDAKYRQQLQSAKDTLSSNLATYLSGIETQKVQYATSLDQSVSESAANYRSAIYQQAQKNEAAIQKAQIDQQTTIQKAQIEAAQKEKKSNNLTYELSDNIRTKMAKWAKNGDSDSANAYLYNLVKDGIITREKASELSDQYFSSTSEGSAPATTKQSPTKADDGFYANFVAQLNEKGKSGIAKSILKPNQINLKKAGYTSYLQYIQDMRSKYIPSALTTPVSSANIIGAQKKTNIVDQRILK